MRYINSLLLSLFLQAHIQTEQICTLTSMFVLVIRGWKYMLAM